MQNLKSVVPLQTWDDLKSIVEKMLGFLSEPKNFTLVAASLAAIYVVYTQLRKMKKSQSSFPDFPGATWLNDHRAIMDKTSSNSEFIRLLNQVGLPAGYVRFRFFKVLAVCDLCCAKELLLTHGLASSGRRSGLPLHLDPKAGRHGVIFTSGEIWKTNRRIFLNFLRQWGRENQLDLIFEESKFLIEAIESERGEVEPSYLLQGAVCNVISSLIFGSRIEYSDPRINKIFESILAINQRNQYLPEFIMRFMIRFPVFTWVKKRKMALKRTKDYLREQIVSIVETGIRNPPETLVEAYALEKTNLVMKKDETELEALIVLIFELFFAGTETTSTTLQWALACLALNPEVQEKMFQEIDSVLGSSKPTSKNLKDLPYTTAVQLEIQRIGCIAPTTILHSMLDDVTLDSGIRVPKRQSLYVSLFWIMRDKRYWKESESFCPENFLDENGNVVISEAFVPYGIGARICLGQQLADLELKIFIIQLVRSFIITSNDKIDLTDVVHRITCGPKLYKYTFVPR